jgi:hypothetical protein
MGGEGKFVEADKTFVGGKARNRAYREPPAKDEDWSFGNGEAFLASAVAEAPGSVRWRKHSYLRSRSATDPMRTLDAPLELRVPIPI